MMEFLSSPAALAGFVLTYLVHSTLAVCTALWLLRYVCRIETEVRVLVWKAALVVPVVTSLGVVAFGLPHFGVRMVLSDAWRMPGSAEETTHTVARSAANREADTQVAAAAAPSAAADQASRVGEADGRAEGRAEPSRGAPALRAYSAAVWPAMAIVWSAGIAIGCLRIGGQAVRLRRLRRRGRPILDDSIRASVDHLARRAGIRRPVALLETSDRHGPMTAGILRPFILIPSIFLKMLSPRERQALFAHELAHIARRDALWNLIVQLVCRIFFFQPLNRVARRQLQLETEFVADWQAVRMLEEPAGLAGCLARLGQWLADGRHLAARPHALAAGMASFRSTLGRRVETLLTGNLETRKSSRRLHVAAVALVAVGAVATIGFAPRAVARPKTITETLTENRNPTMTRSMTTLVLLAGMTVPPAAQGEAPQQDAAKQAAALRTTPDELPDGMQKFNGMLVGRLARKDVEKGTFIVTVDRVPRVWRNSKAENPKSILGKSVEVDGVFGKWLDVLLVVKEGETLEFEARHDGGNRLTFPGELLRKVAPVSAGDYPELPEEFRGFEGIFIGTITKKDDETMEVILNVIDVKNTWKKNKAKEPESIVGKKAMLAGFWQRRDEYHDLKVGDTIECGAQHIELRSDHLTVAEYVRKVDRSAGTDERPERETAGSGFPEGMRGFGGVLIGRLVSKDLEKGEIVIVAEQAPRVWKRNEARNTDSCKGREFTVRGISGKFVDVLVTMKPGDRLEIAAAHNRGDALDFPGELLRKID